MEDEEEFYLITITKKDLTFAIAMWQGMAEAYRIAVKHHQGEDVEIPEEIDELIGSVENSSQAIQLAEYFEALVVDLENQIKAQEDK